ncbi:MAG: stage II sporulation protein M [Halobacteriales archaeon]|nr:stage II sporulation protein M [Halobacteriales archaeon]
MDINDAFRSAYSALVTKPSKILPFYFMSVSVPAVVRIAPILTGVLVYFALARRGNIDEIQTVLEDLPTEEFENPGSPGSFEDFGGSSASSGFEEEFLDSLRELADLVLVPEVIAIISISVVVFFLLTVILNAVVSAGQVNVLYSALVGGEPVRDGVEGVFSDTKPFVLLLLLETVLLLVSTAILLAAGVAAVSVVGGIAGGLLGLVVFLVWLLALLVIHTMFIFAPQSVVVDGNGVFGAVRGSLDFIFENPVEFIAYVIFAFAATIAFGSVAGFLNILGAPAAVSVLGFVVFAPFVGVVKTDMYTRHADEEVVLTRDASLSPERTVDGFRRGWDEMVSFTVTNIPLIAVCAVLLFGAGAVAWEYTIGADIGIETSIADRIEQLTPVGGFVNFTANNWAVAVAQSYAGFVFGIGTVVSLVFNGVALGFLAATETNLPELVAFVVPHGIVEIPALLISGALGLRLGIVSVGYVRGSVSVAEISDEVSTAYQVLVGLLILFAVAGLIEGFFSPYYYDILFDL